MSTWKIGYWLVGTLGVAGTIALFAFFPAVFGVALKAVVRFFSIVLSYRAGCALVAAIVAAFIADYWRHSRDDAEFARRVAAFERAQDERDKKIAADTEVMVRKTIAEEFIADQDAKNEVDSFKKDLPANDVFRVGDDAPRLRRIAGETVSEPAGPKGVPAPRRPGTSTEDRRELRLPGAGR